MKPKKIPFISLVDLLATKKSWEWELGDFKVSINYYSGSDIYNFHTCYTSNEFKDMFSQDISVPAAELPTRYAVLINNIQVAYNQMVSKYLKYFDKCSICGGQS